MLKQKFRVHALLCAVYCAVMLGGCGFQLRERLRLPEGIQAMQVQSADPLSPLTVELERALQANDAYAGNGAEMSETMAILELQSEGISREILSVNDRARVSEFVLIGRATARLLGAQKNPDGSVNELIAPFELSVRREYSFDEAQALGAAQEEEIISAELKRELAQLILLKLQR